MKNLFKKHAREPRYTVMVADSCGGANIATFTDKQLARQYADHLNEIKTDPTVEYFVA